MNDLLIFFAFPIAVIIVSIALQKSINNPILVSLLIFAVFLIITFAFFDESFLIETLAYTVLALITAFITKVLNNSDNSNICNCLNDVLGNNEETNNNCTRTNEQNTKNNCFDYTYNRYKNF